MTYDPSAYPPAGYPQQPTGAYPPAGYPQAQPTGAYPPAAYPQQPAGWQSHGQDAAYAPAPAQPRPNPLATMPVSDWIRDGAALVLLLVSLAMPWSLRFTLSAYEGGYLAIGATRIEVVLITVLSVLSLAVTYLARFGALGAGMTTGRTAALRASLNAPYALLILVYVVLDATKIGDLGASGLGVGLGAGATLGLAGALFAASPRAHEVGAADRRWPIVRAAYAAFAVFFGVAALTVLLGLVLLAVTLSGLSSAYGQYNLLAEGFGGPSAPAGLIIAAGFAAVVVLDAAVVVPTVFVLRRSPSAPRIAAVVGIAVLVATVIASFTGFSLGMGVASLYQGGYAFLWLGAFAAIMTSPALLAGMRPQAPLTTWFVAARQALVVTVVVAGVLAVFAIVALAAGGSVGFLIGILLCQVVSVVGALIARIQLVSAPDRSRAVVLSIAGGIAAVQVVALILAGVSSGSGGVIGFVSIVPATYLAVLGLPAFVAYALTVPRDVRAYYAAHAPARATAYAAPQGYAPPGYAQTAPPAAASPDPQQAYGAPPVSFAPATPPQQYAPPAAPRQQYGPPAATPPTYAPTVPPAVPVAPPVREEARRAADPATPAEELYGYTSDPTLWPALAANPGLYPELVSWLAATGDPEVLAALRARGA